MASKLVSIVLTAAYHYLPILSLAAVIDSVIVFQAPEWLIGLLAAFCGAAYGVRLAITDEARKRAD